MPATPPNRDCGARFVDGSVEVYGIDAIDGKENERAIWNESAGGGN